MKITARVLVYAVCQFALPCVLCVVSFASTDEAVYRHNEEGMSYVRNNNYDDAIAAFKAALRYAPHNKIVRQNLAAAYNNYGFALRSKGEARRAVEKFEAALVYDPENPYILLNIGQTYYQLQDMGKASSYLDRAARLKSDIAGAEELALKVGAEAEIESSFRRVETMHFALAVSEGVGISESSYLRAQLEEAYGRVGAFLGYYPRQKIPAILYTEDDYEGMLAGRPYWAIAFFDGKVRVPVNRFRFSTEEAIKIIYHEYAHAVVREMTSDRCPLWLNEGVAANAEDLVVRRDPGEFRRALAGARFIPLLNIPDDISRFRPELVWAIYAESYLAVRYIVDRYGQDALRKFLRSFGGGGSPEDAARAAFGETFEEFQNRLRRYLADECGVSSAG